jgi:hypothetical protein
MTFADAPSGEAPGLFGATLPQVRCSACRRVIARRRHRVHIRASWRDSAEDLCPDCWGTICAWAARFALVQTSFLDETLG